MTFAEIKNDAARIAARLKSTGLIKAPAPTVNKSAEAKEEAKKQRSSAKVSATRSARSKRLAPSVMRVLSDGKAHRLRDIANAIYHNNQRALSVVRWLEERRKVHSLRIYETLWVARKGVAIPVERIKSNAIALRRDRSRKRRSVAAEAKARTSALIQAMPMGRARPDVGFDSLEVWRVPQ